MWLKLFWHDTYELWCTLMIVCFASFIIIGFIAGIEYKPRIEGLAACRYVVEYACDGGLRVAESSDTAALYDQRRGARSCCADAVDGVALPDFRWCAVREYRHPARCAGCEDYPLGIVLGLYSSQYPRGLYLWIYARYGPLRSIPWISFRARSLGRTLCIENTTQDSLLPSNILI